MSQSNFSFTPLSPEYLRLRCLFLAPRVRLCDFIPTNFVFFALFPLRQQVFFDSARPAPCKVLFL